MNPPMKGRRRSTRLKEKKRIIPCAHSRLSPPLLDVVSSEKFHRITPPPFSLSFNVDTNSEISGRFATSSTPLNVSKLPPASNPLSKQQIDLSGIDDSAPQNLSISFLTTPTKKFKDKLLLTSWDIPQHVLDQYALRGVTTMFPWQAECLSIPGVLEGRNLVYSAPTSAGKTLIAELLALKCTLELQKKVIIVLPFVSIAQEKCNYLQQVLEPAGVKVGGFIGNQSPPGGFTSVDIAICTIEKANSLVNRLLEENTTHFLGLVIVDELHMVGDPHRGYLLELLLTKLLYISNKKLGKCVQDEKYLRRSIQVVGMSATLPNLKTLATWLGAQLFSTDFRPVPLRQMVKIGTTLFDTNFKTLRTYDRSESHPGDEDDILLVCHETVCKGHSVLIFCPTKAWCENLSHTLAQAKVVEVNDELSSALSDICNQLRRTQVGLDPSLERSIPNGVAFHHAGLTMEEREIVEGAYRQSHIKILVATSTLSSGVNLPARLVIIRTPFFQRSLLDILVYKQMVGRAGRKGVDELGESILMCKPSERAKIVGLFKSAPKPVTSCLSSAGMKNASMSLTAMKRALLEVITSSTANTTSELQSYTSCTLLFAEICQAQSAKDGVKLESLSQSTLEFLVQNEFISSRSDQAQKSRVGNELSYYATQLGAATVASSLSPDEALVVIRDLLKARKNFVLENELHIVYLVTPVYVQNQWPNIDWYKYFCVWERLSPSLKHVAEILGVRESFLAQAVQGRLPERTDVQKETLRVHRRFYTALALHDLVHEVPIILVARQYGATKGLLQTLQSAAGTFAGMVTVFCNKLGWKNLELLVSQFQNRLLFGVERELCDLVKISLLNGFRARALYNAGFHSLPALATANPLLIENCLRSAVPFKSRKNVDENGVQSSSTWCAKLRRGLSEEQAAKEIVAEAQKIIASELNLPTLAWTNKPIINSGIKPPSKVPEIKLKNFRTKRMSPAVNEYSDELSTKKSKIAEPMNVCQTPSRGVTAVSLLPPTANDTAELAPRSISETMETSAGADKSSVGFIEDSLISFSPILSVDHSQNSSIKEQCKQEVSPPKNTESLVAIPDSFADLSFSISFNTYEKLDTACRGEAPSPLIQTQEKNSVRKTALIETKPLKSSVDIALSESQADVVANDKIDESDLVPVCVVAESPAGAAQSLSVVQNSDDVGVQATTKIRKNSAKESNSFLSTSFNVRELSSLCSSQQIQSGVSIIDVTCNKTLFDTFVSECLEQSCVSFSIATTLTEQSDGIGCTVIKAPTLRGLPLPGGSKQVVGIAFSWGGLDAYYMSLCDSVECVSLASRKDAITRIFTKSPKRRLIAFDMKKHAKYLVLINKIFPTSVILDPKIGDWMLNPDQKEKTIHRMVLQYLPDQPSMAEYDDKNPTPLSSLATHACDSRIQASAESILTFSLMLKIETLLESEGLLNSFITVEMPSLLVFVKLELNGMGFSVAKCSEIKNTLQRRLAQLEKEAYTLAHHTFSLTSTEDIAQVLFVELKLPYGGEIGKKTLGANTRRKRTTNFSTAKNVLEKITDLHPLPGIVMEWRRMSSTISKIVFPLFKEAVLHKDLQSTRIHPIVQVHTATGRVTISDPSLQMVPKEFEIGTVRAPSLLSDSQYLDVCETAAGKSDDNLPSTICMRNVFVPFQGGVLLAADYSQLELRILAHLSTDKKLIELLNQDGDVFRLIASEWLAIPPIQVGDKQRQETKQICYGMLYGIGNKALGEQLGIDENDAAQFIESFKSKYPTMKKFIIKTIQECKEEGYIRTLLGRKRYLPSIHSPNVHVRSQAERQAVNSTIQGSAADLVKTAMINIDSELQDIFPTTVLTSRVHVSKTAVLSGAYLVLQLHDELLYEVAENDLPQVAKIVKNGMENAIKLTVKLPVKVNVGLSWGQLRSYSV